jgi:hypothetical protein
MKMDLPKMSLVIAGVFFVCGFLILCDCPGWFAISAGFALPPVIRGNGRIRTWAWIVFVAALLMTGVTWR